ncbi:MAG: SGNH/GDSL hydrolase family protein [Burkholderiales bacterium]
MSLDRRDFLAATAGVAAATVFPAPVRWQGAAATVVLFQGDSITDGGRNRGATEPNSTPGLGNGYPRLIAAAALAAHPTRGLRFYNRGISGNKVPDLRERWTADTLALEPNVLSILIGVNDFWHTLTHGYTGTVREYEEQYAALLADTRRALPRVRLVVLEPFVLRCGAVDKRWFPEFDERRAAAVRVARQARATLVPLQAMFDARAQAVAPEFWAADGVHPTPAGHAAIAEQWRRAVRL